MLTETLLHIDEDLSAEQQRQLLAAIGNDETGLHAAHHSIRNHLLFVAYDSQTMAPHDIAAIAVQSGYHAQLIDF
jgi:hypothetical protein